VPPGKTDSPDGTVIDICGRGECACRSTFLTLSISRRLLKLAAPAREPQVSHLTEFRAIALRMITQPGRKAQDAEH